MRQYPSQTDVQEPADILQARLADLDDILDDVLQMRMLADVL